MSDTAASTQSALAPGSKFKHLRACRVDSEPFGTSGRHKFLALGQPAGAAATAGDEIDQVSCCYYHHLSHRP